MRRRRCCRQQCNDKADSSRPAGRPAGSPLIEQKNWKKCSLRRARGAPRPAPRARARDRNLMDDGAMRALYRSIVFVLIDALIDDVAIRNRCCDTKAGHRGPAGRLAGARVRAEFRLMND